MHWGLFDWVDNNPRFEHLADTYEQRLRVAEYADQAGYWGYHLAEHHGTPLGMAPSPSLLLTAVAQRTQRIRLGPMVFLLPLYHPVRLAQEIAMLDHLSRGRLELGVGRGASPYELALFDVDVSETRDIFKEALEQILAGLSTGRVQENVEIIPRPWQRPYPPLWYPTTNPETIPWLASQGINLLMSWNLPPGLKVGDQVATYRDVWRQHRDEPGRLNGHLAGEPKVGILRHIFVSDSDQEALRIAREAWKSYFGSYNYLWEKHANPRHERQRDLDALVEARLVFVGSPETVRARVRDELDSAGCNYFAACFCWGSLTTEQMLRSIALFTREVRDRVRVAGTPVAPLTANGIVTETATQHAAITQTGA